MSRPSHLYIVTGASRGLGLEFAKQLLDPGHRLLCISRRKNAELDALALSKGAALLQWERDLTDPLPCAEALSAWLAQTSSEHGTPASATLINNAGMVPAIAALADTDPVAIAHGLQPNLTAPMALSAAFLRHFKGDAHTAVRLLNISSGLGRRAMASQAIYCASKAGLDLFSRSVALEQQGKSQPVKVCSLAPGVIDTDMQHQMRSAPTTDFPDRERFVQLAAQQQLASAADTALRILAYLHSAAFGNEVIADIREIAA